MVHKFCISIEIILDCTIQNLRLWSPYPLYDRKTFSPSNEVWTEKIDAATKEITWEPNVAPTWRSSSKSFTKYLEVLVSSVLCSGISVFIIMSIYNSILIILYLSVLLFFIRLERT